MSDAPSRGEPALDDLGPEDGPPVLLFHGHPFDRSMWRPQAERLAAAGHRALVPDLRGYGAAPATDPTTPFDAFARDGAALLDRLGLDAAVVGGLSMGGQIAMEFHRLFPDRVRGLLLAATSAPPETPEGRDRRDAAADRVLDEGMDAYARELLPGMLAPATAERDPDLARYVLEMMRAAPPRGAVAGLRGRARRADPRPSLARAAVPTLVVVGTEDPFTPVEEAHTIRDLVPGARLEVLPGTAHLPNLEDPEGFGRALDPLLETITP
ncbi:alpha/beta fold hydrolase [Nocardiopsis sp. RSe5-2]|uniref:Alpha/beta fold hydrolase n=1 Tax=Nocardiopsis endophytica TaxID=3018445 RepID=A0ABT4U484_9ACTN|nr:alpha/beta fold hydrolase [Nocardiopsis endophytica]MDA2811521.1 alpha/beta fold hydrolase [Nocardiopsis endophytica]